MGTNFSQISNCWTCEKIERIYHTCEEFVGILHESDRFVRICRIDKYVRGVKKRERICHIGNHYDRLGRVCEEFVTNPKVFITNEGL